MSAAELDGEPLRRLLSRRIRELAVDYRFDKVAIGPARIDGGVASEYRHFVDSGRVAQMEWFSRSLEMRLSPEFFMPGVRSVAALATSYRPSEVDPRLRTIARYAHGIDYHRLLRKRGAHLMRQLSAEFSEFYPGFSGRVTVDSAPVAEKALALQAGLGWQGRHTLLIDRELGSFFFLTLLFFNVDAEYDLPAKSRCGECRRCEVACPTGALCEGRLDARLCHAWRSVERATPLMPEEVREVGGSIYGCDICQEVCPWNESATSFCREEAFLPHRSLIDYAQSGRIEMESLRSTSLGRRGEELLRANWCAGRAAVL